MNTTTTIFGGAGLVALIAALWDQVRLYWSKIWGLLFVKMSLSGNGEGRKAMQILILKRFSRTPFDAKYFHIISEFVRPRQKNELVALERLNLVPTIWWRNKYPIIISDDGATLTFIRGTFDAYELMNEALEEYNGERSSKHYKQYDRFFVRKLCGSLGIKNHADGNPGRRSTVEVSPESALKEVAENSCDKYSSIPLKWTREELGQPKKDSAINDMSLTSEILEAVEEAVRWRESEEWFKNRNIPWKKGFLMTGEPGTGKTAFTRALGQELNMPILSFDLTTMSNSDFNDFWITAKNNAPCIILFEDIDAVFDKRKNISCGLEKGLSFDCLLNAIDGVENSDGIFTVITTNNLDKIDSALGGIVNGNGMTTRPGRIDKTLIFKALDFKGREKMANRILQGFDPTLWKHLLQEKHEDTGAQFQERCCKLALRLFWENKGK